MEDNQQSASHGQTSITETHHEEEKDAKPAAAITTRESSLATTGTPKKQQRPRKARNPRQLPTKTSSSPSSTKEIYKKCHQILKHIQKEDYKRGSFFAQPVDETLHSAPNYNTIIRNPMDLQTLERKMRGWSNPTFKKDIVKEFSRLMRLMFENAMVYNSREDHVVHVAAKELLDLFEREFVELERLHPHLHQEAAEDEKKKNDLLGDIVQTAVAVATGEHQDYNTQDIPPIPKRPPKSSRKHGRKRERSVGTLTNPTSATSSIPSTNTTVAPKKAHVTIDDNDDDVTMQDTNDSNFITSTSYNTTQKEEHLALVKDMMSSLNEQMVQMSQHMSTMVTQMNSLQGMVLKLSVSQDEEEEKTLPVEEPKNEKGENGITTTTATTSLPTRRRKQRRGPKRERSKGQRIPKTSNRPSKMTAVGDGGDGAAATTTTTTAHTVSPLSHPSSSSRSRGRDSRGRSRGGRGGRGSSRSPTRKRSTSPRPPTSKPLEERWTPPSPPNPTIVDDVEEEDNVAKEVEDKASSEKGKEKTKNKKTKGKGEEKKEQNESKSEELEDGEISSAAQSPTISNEEKDSSGAADAQVYDGIPSAAASSSRQAVKNMPSTFMNFDDDQTDLEEGNISDSQVDWTMMVGDDGHANSESNKNEERQGKEETKEEDADLLLDHARKQAAKASAQSADKKSRTEKNIAKLQAKQQKDLSTFMTKASETMEERKEQELKQQKEKEEEESAEAEAARAAAKAIADIEQTVDIDEQNDLMKQMDFFQRDVSYGSINSDIQF